MGNIGAAVLSFIIPGFGHFAIRQPIKGILLFVFWVLVILMLLYLLGIRGACIGGFFYALASAFDAFISS